MVFDFFDDYQKYHQMHTDSPSRFAMWLSIAAMGNAIGKRGKITLSRPVYLNFYLILVAMSRKLRKSTSIMLMQDVIDQNTLLSHPNSPVKFIRQLEGREHSILIYSELMALFRKIAQARSAMAELGEEMCDAYDGAALSSSSIASGESAANNYFLSIVGGTTPDKFTDNLTHDLIEGGLYSRFLIVWEKEPHTRPQPDASNEMAGMRVRVQNDLIAIAKFLYEFKLSGAIKDEEGTLVDAWVTRFPESESTAECYQRYVEKVACLLALNEWWKTRDPANLNVRESINIVPSIDDFHKAWRLVDKCLQDSAELQRGFCEDRELNTVRRRAEKIARTTGTVKHAKFLSGVRLKAEVIRKCIATMAEAEDCCIHHEEGTWEYCFKPLVEPCGDRCNAHTHVPKGYLFGSSHDRELTEDE